MPWIGHLIALNAPVTNVAPVAVADSYSTPEDTGLSVSAPGVLGNDTDADGNPLTASLVTDVSHGTLVLDSSGSFIYTPAANYHGADSFTYQAYDGTAYSNTVTVSLNVTSVNDAPVVVNDTYTTAEDTPVSDNVLANDSDPDGPPPLFATIAATSAHGSVGMGSDGLFIYTPAANWFGTDTFTYWAVDNAGAYTHGTVTVNVTAVNDAPVAVDDSYTTAEDTFLFVDAPGVLANDTDADGPWLMVSDFTGASHGAVGFGADGQFYYTPEADYSGPDSCTYTVIDGEFADTATIYINVTSVNDPPVAVDDSGTTAEDTPVAVTVLANDSDPDADTLSVTSATNPANGTTVVNGDNTITYTPDANYHGSDSFDYTVSDGHGGTDTGTVPITVTSVNDAPVAISPTTSTNEDQVLNMPPIGLFWLVSDADGDPLTLSIVTSTSHGTLVPNLLNGSWVYTPDANWHGIDSFEFRAWDGTAYSNTGTQSIAVASVNDAPVAVDDLATTPEDTAVPVAVLSNDTDVDADTLSVNSATDPPNGTAVVNGDNTITYTPDSGHNGADSFDYTVSDGHGGTDTGTVNVTVSSENDAPVAVDDSATTAEDTLLNVAAPGVLGNDTDPDGDTVTVTDYTDPPYGTATMNADGSFTYTPDADYNGSDSFDYSVWDGQDGFDTATVNITVTSVNDAPVANDSATGTNEDQVLVMPTPGLLGLVTDADFDPCTVSLVDPPSNGGVVVNANGSFTYTPNADFYGLDSFTYRAWDGTVYSNTANMNVAVSPVNDAPVAVDDSATTAEDVPVDVTVLANDSDIDRDALSVTGATDPPNGTAVVNGDNTITYTPDAGYNGSDSFDYTVSDGHGGTDTGTVNVTVSSENDAPVAVDDSATTAEDTVLNVAAPGVLSNDTDVDGDPLSVMGYTDPPHGTATMHADGSFTYTPDADYHGADSFDYTVYDGNGEIDTGTVSITVTPVNDPPVAISPTTGTNEDQVLNMPPIGLFWLVSDVDGDPLTLSIVTSTSHGILVPNLLTGAWVYTPDPNWHGIDSFKFRAWDGSEYSNTGTQSIAVASVNDAPVAVDDSATTTENTAVGINVLSNDTDVDLDTLSATGATTPGHGTAVVNGDSTITYTPNAGYNGSDSFDYTVDDGHGGTDTGTVNVTVSSENDAPVAVDDSATTAEDTATDVNVLGNDSDPDGDTLAVSGVTDPPSGTVSVNLDGTVHYVPDANYNGSDSFDYTISDGHGGTDTATVTMTVVAGERATGREQCGHGHERGPGPRHADARTARPRDRRRLRSVHRLTRRPAIARWSRRELERDVRHTPDANCNGATRSPTEPGTARRSRTPRV